MFAVALMCSSCPFNFSDAVGISVVSYTDEGGDYTETRTPGRFDEIHSYGPFNVYFIQSQESKVVVEGKKEFVDKVTTVVKDDDLTISLKKGKYNHPVLKVTVYAPDVEEITLTGSGDLFDMEGHISDDDVKYVNAGSGDINVAKLKCEDFEARVAGGGDISIGTLTAKEVEMSFSGSDNGRIEKADVAGKLELSISGSGNFVVNGKAGSVEARISGSGDIGGKLEYGSISTHKSGSGNINFN